MKKHLLDGVRKVYKNKEIVCIFQPHRISRLKNLLDEFSKSFKKADTIILCPIFKAGENIKLGFSYNNFAKKIICYEKNLKGISEKLSNKIYLVKPLLRKEIYKYQKNEKTTIAE